jgi:protoporphyrin/coproporphyrin ferrochelatase
MTPYLGTPGFKHGATAPLGVLVCNLGTPAAPTTGAVRRYLAEFLADPRVVELPRLLWLPLLHGIILNVRPRRSAHAYRTIWTDRGSPLMLHSQTQRDGLQARLDGQVPGGVVVALGMRYGEPSIASALRGLAQANVRRVLVLPLYPQYSAPSTASVLDAVSRELMQWRWVPEIRTVNDYHADPAYIAALASSVREHWAAHGRGDRLMMSFHGIPRSYFLAGDPYYCQCHATGRLLAETLGLAPGEWILTFQSRFGREPWLQPYTDHTLEAMARDGLKHIDVVCPGFAADCLETLEEIAVQNNEAFVALGGSGLRYIPALNARADHLDALSALVLRHCQGWPEIARGFDTASAAASATRAKALGADG